MNGFHHLQVRSQVSQGLEPFPSTDKTKRIFDYVMYGVGILAPAALIPQIFQIYSTKSGAGLSLATWILLTISNIMWVIYAVIHKDKHIMVASGLMVFFNSLVVLGVLIY